MPRIVYESKKFGPAALDVIAVANDICAQYQRQGLDLTLRQLYYQFVSRDLIANQQKEYKRLGSIINSARLAGLMDWDYIVDRTRNLEELPHWSSPGNGIRAIEEQYRTDRWGDQPYRCEVWIEKDALVGVLDAVCPRNDVPYFSCRGYTSQSEVWGAAQRLGEYVERGQAVGIIHLGDHDPSGIDMTRDIEERIQNYMTQDYLNRHPDEFPGEKSVSVVNIRLAMRERCGGNDPLEIRRIALNMNQVEEYDPPPNPAKLTDSRATGYIDRYGDESWELDALEPATLISLIDDNIESFRDEDRWAVSTDKMERDRYRLALVREHWDLVVETIEQAAMDADEGE